MKIWKRSYSGGCAWRIKNKYFRMGHMGSIMEEDIDITLRRIEEVLKEKSS
jgi:aspartate aminotransferase-like enzyme